MTPAFTRSALNKGIQMKPLSERLKTFSASQFIDWLCLACVDVREVHTPYDAQEEINKIREALTERLSTLQEQLTATTNSLTNAQEALKSAGIEADTVQAGVMELVSRMNQVAAKGKELAEEAVYVYGKYNDEMAPDMVCDGQTIQEFFDVANSTKTTDAFLNAVRAEGGPSLQANDLKALMRFNDTCDDGEGYDIGDEAMNRLVELGLVAKERGKMRVITSFGMWVIAREQGEESGVLKTQRDRDIAFQQKIAQLRAGNAGKDGSHE